MNVKTTTTLLHKWLLNNGFTFKGNAKNTSSSYYCKKDIQLRISDHLTEKEIVMEYASKDNSLH